MSTFSPGVLPWRGKGRAAIKEPIAQTFLSAQWGEQWVTIGVNAADELRRLSNARLLTCPGCGSPVILHAGTVRAHHFAHLPGAICSAPQTEPETEEHRAGKLLLARWLLACLPDATIIVEAHIEETNQRADVLVVLAADAGTRMTDEGSQKPHVAKPQVASPESRILNPEPSLQDRSPLSKIVPIRRIAIEYQCANMSAREWRRRHQLYRSVGIQDLWLLGGSRLIREAVPAGSQSNVSPPETAVHKVTILRTQELERGLLWDGAPLLFLDAIGLQLPVETLVRFRPRDDAQAMRPSGRLSARLLCDLPFPFALLDWPEGMHPDAPSPGSREQRTGHIAASPHPIPNTQHLLWHWLAQRHRVTPDTLASFFGLPVKHADVFDCELRAWQAALYYRFLHRRVGDRWWLVEVETWTRAYLPLTFPVHLKRLQSALAEYQELLAAAGFLSLPRGYNRVHATVTDDLTTLPAPPDPAETLRLARYRRTLLREAQAAYQAGR